MQTPTTCKTLAATLMKQPEASAMVLAHANAEKWLADLEDPNEKKLYTRAAREGFLKGLIQQVGHSSKELSRKRQAKKIMDSTDMDQVFSMHCHVQQTVAVLSDPEEKDRYTKVAAEGFLVDVLETLEANGYSVSHKKARKADTSSV